MSIAYWAARMLLELVLAIVAAKLVALAIGWHGRDAKLFVLFTAVPTVVTFWLARWSKWAGIGALIVGSIGYLLLAMLAGSFYAPGAALILVMVPVLLVATFFGRQRAARKFS